MSLIVTAILDGGSTLPHFWSISGLRDTLKSPLLNFYQKHSEVHHRYIKKIPSVPFRDPL